MCDRIIMPDGSEIETIDEDELCLCGNSQKEILTWIIDHIPDLSIGDELDIAHTPFGWEVSIEKSLVAIRRGGKDNA